jgi:hypothetical protein
MRRRPCLVRFDAQDVVVLAASWGAAAVLTEYIDSSATFRRWRSRLSLKIDRLSATRPLTVICRGGQPPTDGEKNRRGSVVTHKPELTVRELCGERALR